MSKPGDKIKVEVKIFFPETTGSNMQRTPYHALSNDILFGVSYKGRGPFKKGL
jgi:hypothetical protein